MGIGMNYRTMLQIASVLVVTSLAVGMVTSMPDAEAATAVDQQQPVIDTSVGGLGIGGPSEQKLAQVVTMSRAGFLTSLRVPASCSSGTLVVEIQGVTEGVPNGTVRATTSATGEDLAGTPGEFREIFFSKPAATSAGDVLGIVLQSLGSCGIFRGPTGNPYPGGSGYYDARPNAPGWVILSDRNDLPFQTLVSDTSVPDQPGPSTTATPQPTTSPDPSSTPTPAPTSEPSPSPSPTAIVPVGSLTLSPSTSIATYGDILTMSGAVGEDCGDPPSVTIMRRVAGQDVLEPFTVAEVEDGSFEDSVIARKTADYRATTPLCVSPIQGVRVRKRVTIEVSTGVVPVGESVTITAQLAPCRGHAGDPISLFVDDDEGRFIFLDRKLTTDDCLTSFKQIVLRDTYYLAKSPRTDVLLARGVSQAVAVFTGP